MKVCIVNLHYAPDDAPTGQLMTELAEDLARAGLAVSVITARPSYSNQAARLAVPLQEWRNGVLVHRVRSTRSARGRMVARMMNYVTFLLMALWKALSLPRQDVALVLSSPPFVTLIGLALQSVRRTRLVYNVQDLIPDVIVTTGLLKNPLLVALAEKVSRILLQRSDRVVAIGARMRERILAKGIPSERVVVIHNWAPGVEGRCDLATAKRFREGLDGRLVVLYGGNWGTSHDLETVLDGVARLNSVPATFLFVGGGVRTPSLRCAAERLGGERIQVRPYVQREDLPALLTAADVHLVTLAAGLGGKVVPTKLFAAMFAARPVLLVAPEDSEACDIVRESACGVWVRNGDGAGFAAAVEELWKASAATRSMGENGRRVFDERYDRRHAVRRYLGVLSEASALGPARGL